MSTNSRSWSRNKYRYCTYTTMEASYIGKIVCKWIWIRRYNYRIQRHHQIAFDAMLTNSRSWSRNKYRCCTYAMTEASYIGKTVYKRIWIRRYNYGIRQHHQIAFDAMPTNLRSWSRNKYRCHTYTTTEASYIGKTVSKQIQIRRYNYGIRRHYWIAFDAMSTNSRSWSHDKYRCRTYAMMEASYIGKAVYKQIQIRVGTIMENGWHYWTTFDAMPTSSRS